MRAPSSGLPPFRQSLAASLLLARDAVLAPLRRPLRAAGLSEPQWRIMRELAERPTADHTRLAEAALLHAPSVTRIVRDLEGRGLVIRSEDAADRRRALIRLSPEGEALVAQISQAMGKVYDDYAARFGTERLARLSDELRALSAALIDD